MRWRTADTILLVGVIIAVAASVFTAFIQFKTHQQLTSVLGDMRDAVVSARDQQPASTSPTTAPSTAQAINTQNTATSRPQTQAQTNTQPEQQPAAAIASNTNTQPPQQAGADPAARLNALSRPANPTTTPNESPRVVSTPNQPSESPQQTQNQTPATAPSAAASQSAATPVVASNTPTTNTATATLPANPSTENATSEPEPTPSATSEDETANPEWAASRALVTAIIRELFGGKHDEIMARIDPATDFGRRVNKPMLERGLQKYATHGGFAQLTEGAPAPQVEPQPEARKLYRLNVTLEDGHEVYVAITLNSQGQISTLTWRDGRG